MLDTQPQLQAALQGRDAESFLASISQALRTDRSAFPALRTQLQLLLVRSLLKFA